MMEALTPDEFEREAGTYDAAVRAAAEIDPFCSSSAWVLSAREAWAPRSDTWIRRGDHGYAAFLLHEGAVRILRGFDLVWGFASPLAGPDPAALAAEFAAACRDWDAVLLPGLLPSSRLCRELVRRFSPGAELSLGAPLRRWIAGLEGGLDGYLSRRSAKLRENLRRAGRRAREAGVTVEAFHARGGEEELLRRVLHVERNSWKGPAGTGLLAPDLLAFYRCLARRLLGQGRLRALFARHEGEDIGYILGGVGPGIYRGLQFSFDRRWPDLSLGGLLQEAQIAALAGEGVRTYDLGIDIGYKRRWADRAIETFTLAVVRR